MVFGLGDKMDIDCIEDAVDLLKYGKKIIVKPKISFDRLKVDVIRPEEDLDNLFSIGPEGDLRRLSESRICPMLKGICKTTRCMAWRDGMCNIFDKDEDLVDVFVDDAIHNLPLSISPPTSSTKRVIGYE